MSLWDRVRLAALAMLGLAAPGVSAATTQAVPRGAMVDLRACETLAGRVIAPDRIGLATRGARVVSAVRVPLSARTVVNGETVLPIGPHCVVQGEIASIDPAAPPIHFNLNLPLRWNGVALQSGGGGLGGVVISAPGQKASGMIDPDPLYQPYRLTQGYVVFGSDEGHSKGDIAFYKSDEALRNWAYDYIKKARDVALDVIEAAYGARQRRLYMTGESAGGRETVRAAQRFPTDYDGFVATSPVLSRTVLYGVNVVRSRLIDGWIDGAAIKVIADKTRALCDAVDGLQDNVVARYMECRVPDAALRCPGGAPAAGCLGDKQLAALDVLRNGWTPPAGIVFPNGLTRFTGYGVTGNEDGAQYQYDFYPIGKVPPTRDLPPGLGSEAGRGATLNFAAIWIRHAIAQDPAFNPYDFDPRRFAGRIAYLSGLFDATEPDLSALRRHGGKLIILQPSADMAVPTPLVVDYYRSVVRTMGRAAADRVMRLYIGPGGGHNVVGAAHADLLKVMEAWVDDGIAPPGQLKAEQIDELSLAVERSMPACRYPAYPRYNGSGDPKAAESFTCTVRADPRGDK